MEDIKLFNPTPNKVYLPFALKKHRKETDKIDEYKDWLLKFKLVQNETQALSLARTGSYHVRIFYPNIKSFQEKDIVDLCNWVCLLDEIIEKKIKKEEVSNVGYFLHKLVAKIKSYTLYNSIYFENIGNDELIHKLINALNDVIERIKLWSEITYVNSIINEIVNFILVAEWESFLDISNPLTILDDYCLMRTTNGGGHFANSIIKCINKVEPNINEKRPGLTQVLINSILLVLVIDNDIYSYNKEYEEKNIRNNIITLVNKKYQNNCIISSLNQVIDLRNQILFCYVNQRDKLMKTENNGIYDYLNSLEQMIPGNLIFGKTCKRYNTSNKIIPDLKSSSNFKDSGNIHLDIKSIQWWWRTN
ncbi:hypothetical protein HN014_01175 [Aquimarina sp. TRL1]|uniref:terpene synthase family protein n=1 Tax=Aquimarina sp. (strain TRL1) TaxID=2736252 RepID=UPI00158F1F3E|nr:hypothetical protein [Aquimarina sp. TRL1]QKX03580.1 hypothetical protein HN014_01175 [Aquimarina sp. TRL1]